MIQFSFSRPVASDRFNTLGPSYTFKDTKDMLDHHEFRRWSDFEEHREWVMTRCCPNSDECHGFTLYQETQNGKRWLFGSGNNYRVHGDLPQIRQVERNGQELED